MGRIGKIFRFLLPVIALVALVVFMTGAGRRERATLERNKAIVIRYGEEVWNKGDMAVVDEIIASNYIRHDDTLPEGAIRGRDAYKKYITACRTAWPDFHCTATDVIAQGDKVVVRWADRGTFTGDPGWGIPPNGKEVAWEDLVIHRIAGGKIVEDWSFNQDLSLFYQMGMKLVPAGKQAAK